MITIGGMRDWGIHNGGMRDWGIYNGGMRDGHITWGHEGRAYAMGGMRDGKHLAQDSAILEKIAFPKNGSASRGMIPRE